MVDGSEIFTLPTALEVARRLHDLGVMPVRGTAAARTQRWHRATRGPVPRRHRLRRAPLRQPRGARGADPPRRRRCCSRTRRRAAASSRPGGWRTPPSTSAPCVVPHICAGPISLAANLHVAARCPHIRAIELPYMMAPMWAAFGGGTTLAIERDRRRRASPSGTPRPRRRPRRSRRPPRNPYSPPGARASPDPRRPPRPLRRTIADRTSR